MAAIRSFLLALIAMITVAATASPTPVPDYFEVDACLRFHSSQHAVDEWGQSAWEHYSKKLRDVGRTPTKIQVVVQALDAERVVGMPDKTDVIHALAVAQRRHETILNSLGSIELVSATKELQVNVGQTDRVGADACHANVRAFYVSPGGYCGPANNHICRIACDAHGCMYRHPSWGAWR